MRFLLIIVLVAAEYLHFQWRTYRPIAFSCDVIARTARVLFWAVVEKARRTVVPL